MPIKALKRAVAEALVFHHARKELGLFGPLKKIFTKIKVLSEDDLNYDLYLGHANALQKYAETLIDEPNVIERTDFLRQGMQVHGYSLLNFILAHGLHQQTLVDLDLSLKRKPSPKSKGKITILADYAKRKDPYLKTSSFVEAKNRVLEELEKSGYLTRREGFVFVGPFQLMRLRGLAESKPA